MLTRAPPLLPTPNPPPAAPGNVKRVWHIVEELVQLNVLPLPPNPFEVDFRKLAELPPTERLLMSGALAAFLRELLQQKFSYTELGAPPAPQAAWIALSVSACEGGWWVQSAHPLTGRVRCLSPGMRAVLRDLKRILDIHFRELGAVGHLIIPPSQQ